MQSLPIKSDTIGAAASFLCMIHCVATPFIFIAQACSHSCCSEAPNWWRAIDFAFLAISGLAVIQSVRTSTSRIVKISLWGAWGALSCSILLETFHPALFSEWIKYSSASGLIFAHFYNIKYGKCDTDNCLVHHD
ncbi:MAG: MerC domain-containing protein [Flavobacteriales bacterium]|nr:MerC domain-containing protein [Flavobacteriales bacterium]